jgi:hypothetical protein
MKRIGVGERGSPVNHLRRRPRFAAVLAVCVATMGAGLGTSGCRVNEDDIHRWESTQHGPDKLCAVLRHDKYDNALRVEAAMSLIRMKPRAGRRVGIIGTPQREGMVDTLAQVSPEARQNIVAALVPAIIAELKKPPPVAQAGQPSPPDASYPYKDAAYAMLTLDRTVIIADEAMKQTLRQALIEWAMADFEHRLENRTQIFGMEQLLRYLGPESVIALPKLMTREARKLDQMAALIQELGDPKTKDLGSAALVAIAKYVTSEDWTKNKKPELQAANAASKLEPTEAQFKAQLSQYQDEDLFRVFASMKRVGGRPCIDFLLTFAAQKDQGEKRRQAALAALEGRLDRANPDDTKRIVEIASQPDAPDVVLDQAFRRIGEMPRDQVVGELYKLFRSEKWKVRRAAGGTVLKMSQVKHIDEFMAKLGDIKSFAMGEAITYGASFKDLKEGSPLEAISKYFGNGSPQARTSALSYYLTYGTKADLAAVQKYEGDSQTIPACETDPECKWSCQIQKEGSKDQREDKDIKTIGEYVKYCIAPALVAREPEAKKEEKK